MKPFLNNLNPAVIKSIMLKMNRDEFIETATAIRNYTFELEPSVKRDMFVRLYAWSRSTYSKRFKQENLLFP